MTWSQLPTWHFPYQKRLQLSLFQHSLLPFSLCLGSSSPVLLHFTDGLVWHSIPHFCPHTLFTNSPSWILISGGLTVSEWALVSFISHIHLSFSSTSQLLGMVLGKEPIHSHLSFIDLFCGTCTVVTLGTCTMAIPFWGVPIREQALEYGRMEFSSHFQTNFESCFTHSSTPQFTLFALFPLQKLPYTLLALCMHLIYSPSPWPISDSCAALHIHISEMDVEWMWTGTSKVKECM